MEGQELQRIFSGNIYSARTRLGYSQMRLAELAGISTGFLCDIERGLKTGTFETIAKISAALKKEPYELFIPENIDAVSAISEKLKNDLASSLVSNLVSGLASSLKVSVDKAIQEAVEKFLAGRQ